MIKKLKSPVPLWLWIVISAVAVCIIIFLSVDYIKAKRNKTEPILTKYFDTTDTLSNDNDSKNNSDSSTSAQANDGTNQGIASSGETSTSSSGSTAGSSGQQSSSTTGSTSGDSGVVNGTSNPNLMTGNLEIFDNSGTQISTDLLGSFNSVKGSPVKVRAVSTGNMEYSIVASSSTGYGGSINSVVTNEMTFVPPVTGVYTFSIVRNSDKMIGDQINLKVWNLSGILKIADSNGSNLSPDLNGHFNGTVKTPFTVTALNTGNMGYSIVASSSTGYGGAINSIVTNQMTFVPPVAGQYTFTIVRNSDQMSGYQITLDVK